MTELFDTNIIAEFYKEHGVQSIKKTTDGMTRFGGTFALFLRNLKEILPTTLYPMSVNVLLDGKSEEPWSVVNSQSTENGNVYDIKIPLEVDSFNYLRSIALAYSTIVFEEIENVVGEKALTESYSKLVVDPSYRQYLFNIFQDEQDVNEMTHHLAGNDYSQYQQFVKFIGKENELWQLIAMEAIFEFVFEEWLVDMCVSELDKTHDSYLAYKSAKPNIDEKVKKEFFESIFKLV